MIVWHLIINYQCQHRRLFHLIKSIRNNYENRTCQLLLHHSLCPCMEYTFNLNFANSVWNIFFQIINNFFFQFTAFMSPCAAKSTQIHAFFATTNSTMQFTNCSTTWKCGRFRRQYQSNWHSKSGLSNAITTNNTWTRQWTFIQGKYFLQINFYRFIETFFVWTK